MERYLTNFKGCSTTLAQSSKPSTSSSCKKTSAQKNKEYDLNKRSRQFVDSWKNEFPWANEVERDGKNCIVCSICSEYSNLKKNPSDLDRKNNSFLYGCSSFRKTSLESHAKSVQHVNFATRKKNENSEEPFRNKILTAFSEAEKSSLMILFRNAFAVLKRGKPWTDYEFLCELDIVKGLDIGKTYLNRNSGMQFGRAICTNILNEMSQDFLKANFFSIIIDEATDVSHSEQVVLYVRFSKHGQIKTKFCGIFTVTRANARQITDGVLKSLKNRLGWENQYSNGDENQSEFENNSDNADTSMDSDSSSDEEVDSLPDSDAELSVVEEKAVSAARVSQCNQYKETSVVKQPLLIGMASDGASVLSGKNAGVQALLTKEVNCHMVYIWCISHRLQLSLKDALKKKFKEFNDLNDFLKSLYLFHTNSKVVHAAFHNAVEVKNRNGGTAVSRVDGTRWIAHTTNALTNLLNTVDCHQDCLAALENAENFSASQKAKAKYFKRKRLQTAFVEFIIFILDVLNALSRFSLFSQSRSIPFPAIQSSLEKCVDRLNLLKQDTGRGSEWQRYVKGDYNHVLTQSAVSGQEHLSEATKVMMLDILIDCVKQRCSDSVPLELNKLSPLLNITSWKKDELFSLNCVSSNGIRTWRVSDWLDVEIGNINQCI